MKTSEFLLRLADAEDAIARDIMTTSSDTAKHWPEVADEVFVTAKCRAEALRSQAYALSRCDD